MKKINLLSFLLILLFFDIKTYAITITNIAYLTTSNYKKVSNEVKVEIHEKQLFFREHVENIKVQQLTEQNKITVVGELDLENFNTSFFYFKKNLYDEFYPAKINFFIEKNEALIPIENDPKNIFQTKPIEIEGGKKYKIVSIGEDLKNTLNLKQGEFSLEAFEKSKSLGEVKNKLIIDNDIIVRPNILNEEVQYLDLNRKIETKVDLLFKNLLKEKIVLKLDYDTKNLYVEEVEGKVGDKVVKFYWNKTDNCFYSEEVLLEGDSTIDIIGNGVKSLFKSKEESFTLSVLINKKNYGSITNKIIFESQNKILLEKKSEQKQVRVGDLLKYKLDVTISKEDSFKKFIFKDFLPRGFSVIEKSIKVNNGIVTNINTQTGNGFSFEIDFKNREFQESLLTIEYIVRVGVTSKHGKNINRAIIYGDNFINPILESNLASATVSVDSENFSEKGIILGVVYLDLDGDNEYTFEKDLTIPGVKVILENGDFAITDEDGKYSIYGEDAVTHIGKIDKKSLIKGIKGLKLTAKHSKNGESQFIDLKKAQLYAANFGFKIEDEKNKEEIKEKILKRKKILEESKKEYIYNVESKELSFKGAPNSPEKKEIGEAGIINNLEIVKFEKQELLRPKDGKEPKKVIVENLREKLNILSEDQIQNTIEKMENKLDIMNISNDDIVPENMTFQIKGPSGGGIELYVNNEKVDLSNLSLRASSSVNSLFFLEYSSVKLKKGKNIIKASYIDMFGIERDYVEKVVKVKGELSKIIFEKIEEEEIEESGVNSFLVKGTDEDGLRVPYSLNASILESGGGQWLEVDENKEIQGLQFTIPPNGEKIVKFKPKAGKQKVKFKTKLEHVEKEFEVELVGEIEELFVNGILEGRLNLKGNKSENFFFEKKINNFYKDNLYYRGAGFAQGHLNDEYYLTMTYDSAKEEEKFFAYKDPDDYYPIYGDNSIKGYIGESRDDLYIKIERGQSYVMYGDYKTSNLFDDKLRLNQYSRTLTGFSSKIDNKNIKLNTFIAKTNSQKVIDEFQGEGVSGPYSLSNRDIVEGSEEIKLVTYDKNNGGIISEIPLNRGQNYSIDYNLGRIYFSEPIMGYDLNFNPIFIKVNYELEDETGKKHWVYGTNLNYKIKDKITFGGTYVKDEDILNQYEMNGLYAVYDDQKNLLIIESSRTSEQENGSGIGKSIFYKHENENLKIEAIYEKSTDNYFNPDGKLSQGIERLDVEMKYEFENKNTLKLESELLKDELQGGGYEKRDLYLGLEFAKKGDFIYEIGGKHYYKTENSDIGEVNTLAAKVTWEPEKYSSLKAFLEYEQDILLTDKKRIAGGVDYSVTEETVLYLRQEFISNLSDEYYLEPEDDTNKTLIGVKSTSYLESEVFSEYREKNNENGLLPEVGYGVKKEIEISEKLTLSGTFERIDPIIRNYENKDNGEERKSSTSITLGYDYEIDKISRLKGDFEFEFGNQESFLSKLGYGRKITDSLYFIGKSRYYTEDDNEQESRIILGLAYREHEDSKYNSLNKYELNYSKNIIDDNYKQLANILRSSHNYKFNRKFDGTLTLGVKNIETNYEDIKSNYTAYLIAGSLNYNIYKEWTTGFNISTIFDNDKNADYGLGFEIGYIFENNLWLSLGYNIVGFRDKDFDPAGELNEGAFIRFRMNIGELFN